MSWLGLFARWRDKHARGPGAARLAPEQFLARSQWLEVCLLPLAAVALAWLLRPDDPSVADATFPWLWFAPVLVALRYGVMPGLVACIPLMLNRALSDYVLKHSDSHTLEYLFGGGLLVLLCGEFSDVWRDRNSRMEEASLYMAERLSRLTKRHLLLNLSHDRLEHEMLSRPGSLRDALAKLRSLVLSDRDSMTALPGARDLLQLLTEYVNLESAALYLLEPDGADYVLGAQVTQMGTYNHPLQNDDPMLRMAVETRNLSHIAGQDPAGQQMTGQLVVAPLIAGADALIGVLAVTQIPFFSLNDENLQMMSVILAYYADTVRLGPLVADIQRRLPAMPPMFAEELARMLALQDKVALPSQLVVLQFSGPRREEIPGEFLRIKRGLDLYWQFRVHDRPGLAVLMPFASIAGKDGFLQRVENWCSTRFSGDFLALGVHAHSIDFSSQPVLDVLCTLVLE